MNCFPQFSSVQFSRSVMSDSLWPHESQHTRPPCPSPSPGVHSNSCPSSRWCHPAISSSVVPFSFCPQIPPNIRVFSNESTLCMRWPKYWSFSFSIIPAGKQWMVAKLWLFYRLNIHWLLVKADSIFVFPPLGLACDSIMKGCISRWLKLQAWKKKRNCRHDISK